MFSSKKCMHPYVSSTYTTKTNLGNVLEQDATIWTKIWIVRVKDHGMFAEENGEPLSRTDINFF